MAALGFFAFIYVFYLWSRIDGLEQRIEELEGILNVR